MPWLPNIKCSTSLGDSGKISSGSEDRNSVFVLKLLTAFHVLLLSAWEICRASNLSSSLVPPVSSHQGKQNAIGGKTFLFVVCMDNPRNDGCPQLVCTYAFLALWRQKTSYFFFPEGKRNLIPSKFLDILPKLKIWRQVYLLQITLCFNIFSSSRSNSEALKYSSLFLLSSYMRLHIVVNMQEGIWPVALLDWYSYHWIKFSFITADLTQTLLSLNYFKSTS